MVEDEEADDAIELDEFERWGPFRGMNMSALIELMPLDAPLPAVHPERGPD